MSTRQHVAKDGKSRHGNGVEGQTVWHGVENGDGSTTITKKRVVA